MKAKQTEQTNKIVEELKTSFGDNLIEIRSPRQRRIFARVKKDYLREAFKQITREMKITHLSTITGTDLGPEGIEVQYHLALNDSIIVTLSFTVPKDNLTVPTVIDLIPGAVLYEQEVHEILGLNFEGHPSLGPLFLPEGWPEGVFPMRKEHKFSELRQIKVDMEKGEK